MSDGTVAKWADQAMFKAEPMEQTTPKVYLISMSADPLGEIASCAKMYKGEVVRSMAEVTDEERLQYFDDLTKTTLNAAFESVKFHFMIEGVTRAFTHQLVRQRTAVYFQESMRFAVIDESFADRVGLPPSLVGTTGELLDAKRKLSLGEMSDDDFSSMMQYASDAERKRWNWDTAVNTVEGSYKLLVEQGMPAEEARGLLPTNVLTRIHYVTDLRNLVGHAGLRLCTQAQAEWRHVFSQIASAIREARVHVPSVFRADKESPWQGQSFPVHMADQIADRLFRPICYSTGKCEFMASFDRYCSIRERVNANHEIGRPSSDWTSELDIVEGNPIVSGVGPKSVVRDEKDKPVFIGSIYPAEWLMDDGAARS